MKQIKSLNNKLIIELEKIDSKELAYIIGFICGDSAINNNKVELSVKLEDIEILNFIGSVLGFIPNIDTTLDRTNKRFPRCRITRSIKDILKYTTNQKKKDRNLPIIPKYLNKYMVLGFFDADGCITWGRRKDRDRVWQKVSFTSSKSLLIPIQNILIKELNISTIIRPKSNEDCYVLEFSNKIDVLKFCNWIYSDTNFIILKRKFKRFNALRLELGEFSETINNNDTILSSALDLSKECAETTGELNGTLNNQNSTQA